ncbi:hypothetical protein ASAP_1215 [Asaia bogorensis]|uniref:Uncharacterized protein n=1 Tax=Asaia bogorensis TaxID=91915 RepID=A0A060QED3_9PROT|nr:hypothetical protein ASAP_1215 [Asaia bogorensis]
MKKPASREGEAGLSKGDTVPALSQGQLGDWGDQGSELPVPP